MKGFCGVHQHLQLILLLAAAMAMALDSSHNLASERSSIESTYELTKYLEYQLKEIKDVYLTYLGPPFNEKDFSPPRPNSTALSLPSAATRLELWHGLENQARLAQNQKAYSVLLAAVRELARSTLCPSLKTSLLHFCTGLDGLLGSISALMTTLGYALPPPSSSSSPSLLSVGPTMNDFARKVEGFWILRELQSWLWRSAKDFNRLKKRLRG
ncbi:cardiotrophin-like cytokine factor 1 [Xiphias gladius]|uniref:cardiotrophin-like cytokine factor 1 n=1 Tax=Xiphias gladius TaxID=8245 RepID=UPI001A99BB31|nr:cardiotrophin-like cytokine factor 1 [Xiphias gladius]